MGLRVCLVTPFSWSQPHEVNEHVAAAAAALEGLGHTVCVVAPSNRASDLSAGRRALRRLEGGDGDLPAVLAVGPAVALPSGSRIGVPVGTRANLKLVLARGGFDLVHAHEPAIPSVAFLALRDALALTVATFHSAERLAYPPGKRQREKLLGRIDALTAMTAEIAAEAKERFPGDYLCLPAGIDLGQFRPGREQRKFVLELDADDRPAARAAVRGLRAIPGYELIVLRTRPLQRAPFVPRDLRGRVHVVAGRAPGARADALTGAAGFLPASGGSPRLRLEALACGVPEIFPPGRDEQPELLAAAMGRLAEDADYRRRQSMAARQAAEHESVDALARELDALYRSLTRRRRVKERPEPLADRPWILADLHMHTERSHDCSIPVPALLDHAEAIGLGAIAVTDHNVFGGAQEAVALAKGRELVVIPGEEVKTDGQGEVIGLFLSEEIPRGMSMAETIEAIRGQGGLVYMPHPFDRLHSIPDPATLHRHLAEIDVLEVYNARLLFEAFNDEALRFARKYNLLMGAGSDAHVLQGIGTGALRMRAFRTPEEFLISLRSAEVVRRPKSLLYLQGLKWVAQARERRAAARAG
jgi:predicted metal-dependent phosphoesterase TrpH/glycosyltransferase involved in cell wall biosynthesis